MYLSQELELAAALEDRATMDAVNHVMMDVAAWFMGAAPATLLRKRQLVSSGPDRLGVYTLTFANPPGVEPGFRMDLGDIVKVCVPDCRPKRPRPLLLCEKRARD